MFSMCSELIPRARIPDARIPQHMQPCTQVSHIHFIVESFFALEQQLLRDFVLRTNTKAFSKSGTKIIRTLYDLLRWLIWRSESILLPPLFYLIAAEKEKVRNFWKSCRLPKINSCQDNTVHPLVV